MGAYLSSPETETRSEDFTDSHNLSYGVSRMQGWRISMEDAHNCVPNITDDNSLFGVYDGHGGSEVALYCALHFSDTLKDLTSYQEGNYEASLKEAFMAIDKQLLKTEVVRELKVLAERELDDARPTKEDIDKAEALRQDEEECEEDEMAMLHEEATMSIEELLARYGKIASATNKVLSKAKSVKSEATSSSQSEDDAEPSCGSSSSISISKDQAASSTSDLKEQRIHKKDIIELDVGGSSSTSKECRTECSGANVSSSSSEEKPGSSSQDAASKSSKNDMVSTSSSGVTDQPCPSSSNIISSDDVTTSSDTEPKKSGDNVNRKNTAEQSSEITCSDSVEKDSLSENSSDSGSICSSTNIKKVFNRKINPKAKTQVKFGIGDDDNFEPELSGSESEDDGFDSDEAVEGSSESEEEESEEESDDEDPDDIEIPPLKAMASTKEEPGKDSGTTAVVALLNKHNLFVANAGDSRCVVCRNGTAFDMSEDHKPEDPKELLRIKAAGGYVAGGRVNGGLNLSRAIGDHCYKLNENFDLENQIISAMPDVKKITLQKGDQFMVLACDGIWNTLSSQEVVDFVLSKLDTVDSEKPKLSSICEELMMKCLAPDTSGDGTGCDNMTCIIVKFDNDWLAKSPCLINADDKAALVNVKTEDGSGEAVKKQKANGLNDTEDTNATNCLKRHIDDTDNGNCDYPNNEAKVQKVE